MKTAILALTLHGLDAGSAVIGRGLHLSGPVSDMTVKPYALGSAIIIGAWLALAAFGGLLNRATGWSSDTLEAVIGGTGLVLAVAVVAQFQRRGLAFRHCLPVAAVVLGCLAAFLILEYGP